MGLKVNLITRRRESTDQTVIVHVHRLSVLVSDIVVRLEVAHDHANATIIHRDILRRQVAVRTNKVREK